MHIIVVADFGVPDGGAPKVAVESARALAEAGVPVTFVHSVGEEADPLLEHPGIEVVGLGLTDVWKLPIHRAAPAGVWNARAGHVLGKMFDHIRRPDSIVHVHQWTKALSPAGFAAVRRVGLPLVVTMHDYFLVCPTGLFYRFDRQEPCALAPLSLACCAVPCDPRSRAHKLVRLARSMALRRALNGATLDLVHVSDRGHRTVEPFAPVGARHHRVDNPVSIAHGPPATIGSTARALYLGRFTREKGAVLAAHAAAAAGVQLIAVGEGPAMEEMRAACPDIDLRSWVPADQVGALLRDEAMVLLAPSLWPETGPLTVYEALAAGVPALASNRSGASEKVRDGVTGRIAEPQVEAFAQALREIAAPGVAARMGEAAHRAYWAAPPDAAAHARALLPVYRTALAGR
jgi:glycosyltransferase involved in cell wall biosynthesis